MRKNAMHLLQREEIWNQTIIDSAVRNEVIKFLKIQGIRIIQSQSQILEEDSCTKRYKYSALLQNN